MCPVPREVDPCPDCGKRFNWTLHDACPHCESFAVPAESA